MESWPIEMGATENAKTIAQINQEIKHEAEIDKTNPIRKSNNAPL